jgi:hypothetical protein
VAADVTIGFVLQLDRASRMVAQHAVNAQYPGLEDVIDRLITATWDAPTATPYEAAIRRAEEKVLVDRVMWLALASPNSQVRAIASMKLSKLSARAKTALNKTSWTAQRTLIAADIKRFSALLDLSGRSYCQRRTRRRGPRSATRAGIGWPRRPGIRGRRSTGIPGRNPSCERTPRCQLLRSELNLINIVIKLRELNGHKRLASLDEVDRRLALPD